MPEMNLEEIKGLLTTFKEEVQQSIDTKSKEGSDAANVEITALKEKLATAEKGIADIQEAVKKRFGLPGLADDKDKSRWSWAKYFVGMAKEFRAVKGLEDLASVKNFWDKTGSFEASICREYRDRVGIEDKAFNSDDGSDGGFLVPPEIYQGDVIETVYANTAIMKMPVLKFENLKGDLPIPVDNGNLTAYSLGETEAPTNTSSSFGLKWLRPKKIGVYVRVSNRLLAQTNNAIEMIVKNKMSMDASVELSRCLTNGLGADSEGKGILQYYSQMTGTKNIATNGRRFTIDDLAEMKQVLAVANELRDTNTYGSIMHPAVLWGMLREKTEMYSGQGSRLGHPKIGSILIDQSAIQNALKLAIEHTTQIPSGTVGQSTTATKVITGDWSKFAYASFRDPIFRVSDVASDSSGRSALLNDELLMVMFLEYDCICLRPTSFCGYDGAITNFTN